LLNIVARKYPTPHERNVTKLWKKYAASDATGKAIRSLAIIDDSRALRNVPIAAQSIPIPTVLSRSRSSPKTGPGILESRGRH